MPVTTRSGQGPQRAWNVDPNAWVAPAPESAEVQLAQEIMTLPAQAREVIIEQFLDICVDFNVHEGKFLIRANENEPWQSAIRNAHLPMHCIVLESIPDDVLGGPLIPFVQAIVPGMIVGLNPRAFALANYDLYWEIIYMLCRTQEIKFQDMKAAFMFCKHIKACRKDEVLGNIKVSTMRLRVWSLTFEEQYGPFAWRALERAQGGLEIFPNLKVLTFRYCTRCRGLRCPGAAWGQVTAARYNVSELWNRLNRYTNDYQLKPDHGGRKPPQVFQGHPPAGHVMVPGPDPMVFTPCASKYAQSFWLQPRGTMEQPTRCCPALPHPVQVFQAQGLLGTQRLTGWPDRASIGYMHEVQV